MKLFEAFEALDALNEETFTVSDDGIEKLDAFISEEDSDKDTVDVIDPDAETEEEIEDTYVGKVILDCSVCHSKIYKDKTEVTVDEEAELANVGEDCPYCYTSDGFKVIGEVAPLEDKTEVEPTEEKSEEEVTESLTEAAVGTLDRPMSKLSGTLSNVLEAHQTELASLTSREDTIEFLDEIEPEVKNKRYLEIVKEKISKLPDFKVLTFLYNIILKGDGMGAKMESLTESHRADRHRLTAEIFDILAENGFDVDDEGVIDYAFAASDLAFEEYLTGPEKTVGEIAQQWFKDTKANYPEDLEALSKLNECILSRKKKSESGNASGEANRLVGKAFGEALEESVNNVNVETDDSVVNVNTDENGKVTVTTEPVNPETSSEESEVIVPVSDETQDAIINGGEEEDVAIDEFDEESFDELGESYLKKVYENVQSFKTVDVASNGNELFVEGLITFNSGSTKKTSFKFESKDCTKGGTYRFIGENKQLTEGKKSFTVTGKIQDKKFISESLSYNYTDSDNFITGEVSR